MSARTTLVAQRDEINTLTAEIATLHEQLTRKDAALLTQDAVRAQLVGALKLASEALTAGWSYVKDAGPADEFGTAGAAIDAALIAAGVAP